MSKIIFLEGEVQESDKDRAPEPSEIIYSKKYKERKESDVTNDGE